MTDVLAVGYGRQDGASAGDPRRGQHQTDAWQAEAPLDDGAFGSCERCNEPVLPHRVCPNCGFYQRREVVHMEEEK